MSRVLPILFNTDMVRAILDGRKTVTRRLTKPQPKMQLSYICMGHNHGKWNYPPHCVEQSGWDEKYRRIEGLTAEDELMCWTPPCHTGDVLWARETWQYCCRYTKHSPVTHCKYCYKASNESAFYGCIEECGEICNWRPSIHMPKEAARIWLKVTDVRVERLQEITADEALKEGIYPSECRTCDGAFACDCCPDEGYDEVDGFEELWNSTIKKSDLDRYGWDANPWVWAIEFERCEKPEGWCA